MRLSSEEKTTKKPLIDRPPIIEINLTEGKPNTLLADVQASAGFGERLKNTKRLEELPAISLCPRHLLG